MCKHHNDGVYGVVLAVHCRPTNRFLMLQELKDKPKVFKVADMLALPSETKNESDRCVCATANRLVEEEIGELQAVIRILPEPMLHFKHGIPVYAAWAIVSVEFEASPTDDDVKYHGWSSASEIRDMSKFKDRLRIETLDVLDATCAVMGRASSFV